MCVSGLHVKIESDDCSLDTIPSSTDQSEHELPSSSSTSTPIINTTTAGHHQSASAALQTHLPHTTTAGHHQSAAAALQTHLPHTTTAGHHQSTAAALPTQLPHTTTSTEPLQYSTLTNVVTSQQGGDVTRAPGCKSTVHKYASGLLHTTVSAHNNAAAGMDSSTSRNNISSLHHRNNDGRDNIKTYIESEAFSQITADYLAASTVPDRTQFPAFPFVPSMSSQPSLGGTAHVDNSSNVPQTRVGVHPVGNVQYNTLFPPVCSQPTSMGH